MLRRNQPNDITLVGFQDTRDGSYPRDAAVNAELRDGAGNVVAGAENIPLALVPETTGAGTTYRGTIPETVPLPNPFYLVVATAARGGDEVELVSRENVTN